MADGGYFKGTSADQDNRFADKKRKLMKSMKFGEGLDRKVDMSKVNIDVIKPWITRRVTEMLGIEDDVVVGYIFNQLEDRYPDAKEMQINLTGFLNAKNSRLLLSELWGHLASAMESTSGIPNEFMEQKKEEIKKRQAEMDLIQLNARKIEEEVQRVERREHGSPGRHSSSDSVSRGEKLLKVVLDSQEDVPRKRRHYRKKNSESSDGRYEDHGGKHDPPKPRRRSPRNSTSRDGPDPRYQSSSPSHRRSMKERCRSTERCNSPQRRGRSPTNRSLRQESRRTVPKRESSGRRPVAKRGERHSYSSENEEPRKVESPVRFGASSPPDAWRREPRKNHRSIPPRRKQAMLEIASSGDENKQRRKSVRLPCTSESENSDHGTYEKNVMREASSPRPRKIRDRLENRSNVSEPSNGRVHSLPFSMNYRRLPPSPSSLSSRRRADTTPCATYPPRRETISTSKERKRGHRTPITERLKRMAEQPMDELVLSVCVPLKRQRSLSPRNQPLLSPRDRIMSSCLLSKAEARFTYVRRSESPQNPNDSSSQQSPESLRKGRQLERAPSHPGSDDSVRKLTTEKTLKKEKKRKKHKKHKRKKVKDRRGSESEGSGSSLDELRREALCSMVTKK